MIQAGDYTQTKKMMLLKQNFFKTLSPTFVGFFVYSLTHIRRLQDDFPSLKERINLRLTKPSKDKYFTTLLNAIQG